ncbi:hypothetical protein J1N35_012760 [Gossypium stocksii]|uniref:Uncharacterized protein n=1 Tax=Gossypium stocksii TaxID=47602 RepID=A0A9D3W617_9ROSI|nr:hypothetical protein J1N35_012760 [Gossypium stocksii]
MEVLEWDRKENEEMNKFSPRSPYGSLCSNNVNLLDENSKLVLDKKTRISTECGGDASSVETRNDRVLDGSNGGGGRAEVESIQEGEEENDEKEKEKGD